MRVRVWNAFASNNSGSYTIVGSFSSSELAAEVAALFTQVVAEHEAWLTADGTRAPTSPLQELAVREGVTAAGAGFGDDWPDHGGPPAVIHLADQVVMHVGMTISMPAIFGAVIYKRGGRVEVELVHSHHPLVAVFDLWVHEGWKKERVAEREAALTALRTDLDDGRLEASSKHWENGKERIIFPAWRRGEWGSTMTLLLVPRDLVEATRLVRECAKAHGVETRMKVFETPTDAGDWLGFASGFEPAPGTHRVILWAPGAHPGPALRVLRDVTGLPLAEAQELFAKVPVEILVDVSAQEAEAAAEKLRVAGAEVEVVTPDRQRVE